MVQFHFSMGRFDYLKRKGRPVLQINNKSHSLIRILKDVNSDVYPNGQFTDLSTNLSCLCAPIDIIDLKPNLGSIFVYNTIENLRTYKCRIRVDRSTNKGIAIFKLIPRHDPMDDDYSHSIMNTLFVFNADKGTASQFKKIELNRANVDTSAAKKSKELKKARKFFRNEVQNSLFHHEVNKVPIEFEKGFPEFHKKKCGLEES